ncbi:hypothetical protein [Sporolactobacillus terrae]|uniref:hypothetical protein n=1 Tax=Sporolactobacillus terrae TaxID=269673 RepID=UPI001CC0F4F8|nr:hypothetical protein [Sporolactobacillus terrae]UAK17559.1 hypothetical protein K7399_06430 [Sporolactobacillus terrae]
MDFNSVDQYLKKLRYTDLYDALDQPGKEAAIFEATEVLKDHYRESLLTDRIVAVQTLYMLEGEDEDFRKYRRQGVTAMRAKDFDVTFEGREGQTSEYNPISPEVKQIIHCRMPELGRLI